jgi:hypothetical protein
MGSYLFHELTTPLGLRLDEERLKRSVGAPFRSLGTFGVWFPRGLLLRLAARHACRHLLEEWQSGAGSGLTPVEQQLLDASIARIVADPELLPDAVATRIGELAGEHMDCQPREALTRLLLTVEEYSRQPSVHDDPGVWARQMLTRVRDWLGGGVALPGVNVVQQRRSPLTRAIESAAAKLAEDWAGRLSDVLAGLMDHGGRRLAIAEAAVARLIHFCDEAAQNQQSRVQAQASRSAQAQKQLDDALESCLTGAGGWSFFGGRTRRLVRVFIDHLAAFARQCLVEDTAAAVLQFFAALRGRLADRMRDLGFCRQRLRHLHGVLEQSDDASEGDPDNVSDTVTFSRSSGAMAPAGAPLWSASQAASLGQTPLLSTEAFWDSIRRSSTNRVVLPDGDADLEHSARRFVGGLTMDQWTQLDQVVGEVVLAPAGGLLKVCLNNNDLIRYFAIPLLNQAITCLSDHLPITDVAQAEFSADEGLADRITGYLAAAAPALTHQEARPDPGPLADRKRPLPAEVGSGVRRTMIASPGEWLGRDLDDPRLPGGKKPAANADQTAYLLIPASEAGKTFGEEAKRLAPELHLVNVPGQADLTVCREQTALSLDDLERILHPCRGAYYEMSMAPQSSPHARFDIQDWTPLDP